MTDSKVERVAKAVYAANPWFKAGEEWAARQAGEQPKPIAWDDLDADEREQRLRDARAAIEAYEKYKLPCDVQLPPALRIGKGCSLSTLMVAIKRREAFPEADTRFPHRFQIDAALSERA